MTGAERLLADPVRLLGGKAEQLTAAERTRRERTREMSAGIVGFTADRDCGLLAFALSGQLWVVRPAGGLVHRLPARERHPGEAEVDGQPAAPLLGPPVGLDPRQRPHQRRLPVIHMPGGRDHLHANPPIP